jgi:Type II secretory pathway, component PulK
MILLMSRAARQPAYGARRQRGVAIITAIFIVALASIAATAMLTTTNIAIHRMENLQNSEQAEWYALGLQSWVCMLLQRESQLKTVKYDALSDPWAQPVSDLPVDRGTVSGRLIDLQGRFNLNNLATANPQQLKFYSQWLERLIQLLPGNTPFSDANLGVAVHDWVDADNQVAGTGGAEVGYYMSLNPPYRPSNQPMLSRSELLAVSGVSPALYDALAPYVTALPTTDTRVNINTAPAPVLEALAGGSGSGKLSDFLHQRNKQPLTQAAQISALGLLPASANAGQYLDVATSYFRLQAHVDVGGARLDWYAVIQRPQGGGVPTVLRQAMGAP